MRTRLTQTQRRKAILDTAHAEFLKRGFAETDMDHIRSACGLSRGGLYHHFGNKIALLDALVSEEIEALAQSLPPDCATPIPTLLRSGSNDLGAPAGLLSALTTHDARRSYLTALDTAFATHLAPALTNALAGRTAPGIPPAHVSELVLIVAARINRHRLLGHWTASQSSGFAATALRAVAPLLDIPEQLDPLIAEFAAQATP